MIARTWRGRATAERADDYYRHFSTDVARNLKEIPGNKGAYLLRRAVGDEVEFVALTFWESIGAIKSFTGEDTEAAHIEPEGRAALSEFDKLARNYEVAFSSIESRRPD